MEFEDIISEGYEIISHPGGGQAPLCVRAERLISEAEENDITEIVENGRVILGYRKGFKDRVKVITIKVPPVKLSRLVQANGIVIDRSHPLSGIFMHSLGSDRFIFGRPVREKYKDTLGTPREEILRAVSADFEAWQKLLSELRVNQ
ncbi:MAG: hypothetical protein ACD_51C00028G0030 [uncultured bacterium]|nr:MAG: hypothetical protein ACD_51C00028G0030 [uncultured bacterium]OGJ47894.1 MAG: hypothetical protein A2244_05445 [Candidatus Peregrinibacteria bacterium RIFOXYA2_FULL_41_18]OGJ49128.1 MAG: hypothetical protein A2344_00970 [Candidatus Peregrinibacteria bacterium RIFOXYB12_FULL_41_12]OGJ52465.1 MAG: hypothetical protein A2336_01990 [Candidatus Peregrinibacteria bacterium RIFOXYB2_FULL_41_88]